MRSGSIRRGITRVALIGAATLLVLGVAGFFFFRFQQPVTLGQALERFHEGNDGVTSGRYELSAERNASEREAQEAGKGGSDGGAVSAGRARTPHHGVDLAARGGPRVGPAHVDVVPAEGVYEYKGSGEERLFPYRRTFSRDTYRIITHEDRDTWTEHHMFSEQRESLTRITTSETGILVHSQRNDVRIGPNDAIDETRLISFDPPITSIRFPYSTGQTWSGTFSGTTEADEDYTGTYRVRALADDVWSVGGVKIRVVGHRIHVEFEGEVSGTVTAEYWVSPTYGLTVREQYDADAKVGPFDYEAKWSVRLESLTPRT